MPSTESPQGDSVQMWVGGVCVAVVPAVYGIRCLISGATTIFGRHGWITISGSAGIAFAIAFLSFACWLHFQYFWTNHGKLWRFSELGKLAALVVLTGSLLFGSFTFLAFG